MQHGCDHRCPKVREQQRKALQAGEKLDKSSSSSIEEIHDAPGPSRLERKGPRSEPRSKESVRYKSGLSSPRRKGPKGPIKGHDDTISRDNLIKSPTRSNERKLHQEIVSPGRSKQTRRDEKYTSGRGSPTLRPIRRSQESQQRRQVRPGEDRKNVQDERRQREDEKGGPQGPRKENGDPDYHRSVRRGKQDQAQAGPSTRTRGRKRPDSPEDAMTSDDELLMDDYETCERHCGGRKKYGLRRMKNEAEQEELDDYILNKGLSYFRNLCNCHCACLVNQLWKDSFVKSTVTSAAVFAVGVKLCSELDGWTISNIL